MTPQELHDLVSSDRRQGVILDTNLLILLWVGRWHESAISKHKRTAAFEISDYQLLERLLQLFGRIVVTPCVLTEASNLVRQGGKARELTGSIQVDFETFDERYLPSSVVSRSAAFVPLGLTDAGIVELARDRWLVVTVDVGLVRFLESQGLDVLNFNHLRFS